MIARIPTVDGDRLTAAARLPLDLWRRLGPRPAAGYSPRRVRAAIKARLRYAVKTRTIKAAIASLKSR